MYKLPSVFVRSLRFFAKRMPASVLVHAGTLVLPQRGKARSASALTLRSVPK